MMWLLAHCDDTAFIQTAEIGRSQATAQGNSASACQNLWPCDMVTAIDYAYKSCVKQQALLTIKDASFLIGC